MVYKKPSVSSTPVKIQVSHREENFTGQSTTALK